jgi:glycosyltransferase involved in cell wall biosynthesis
MKTLTALIPFFNEERTIAELARQLDTLPEGVLTECIFVDDGSTDSSSRLLSQALENVQIKSQILSKTNGGKASAIREGVKALSTTHVVILDSDLELATSDIERLWQVVQAGENDFVFGYRAFLAHSSFTYRYSRGNQLISNLYGIFFNEVITDIMCGYKLVPTQTLQSLPFKYKHFGLEIEIPMQMWLNHQRPYEIDVEYRARTRAQGKSIAVKDAFAVIASMATFRIAHRRRNI